MEVTFITTATGAVIETTTSYFSVRSQVQRGEWVEFDTAEGKRSVLAATVTGFGQATAKAKVGFA